MKKYFALLFACVLFVSPLGCAKPVDKADDPVDGLTVDAPAIGDDSGESTDGSDAK